MTDKLKNTLALRSTIRLILLQDSNIIKLRAKPLVKYNFKNNRKNNKQKDDDGTFWWFLLLLFFGLFILFCYIFYLLFQSGKKNKNNTENFKAGDKKIKVLDIGITLHSTGKFDKNGHQIFAEIQPDVGIKVQPAGKPIEVKVTVVKGPDIPPPTNDEGPITLVEVELDDTFEHNLNANSKRPYEKLEKGSSLKDNSKKVEEKKVEGGALKSRGKIAVKNNAIKLGDKKDTSESAQDETSPGQQQCRKFFNAALCLSLKKLLHPLSVRVSQSPEQSLC